MSDPRPDLHAPQLTLQSVTGVDVELRIAGPGSRSFAFVIDWHVRVVLALSWYFLASFSYFGRFVTIGYGMATPGYEFAVVLPMFAIYFFYHPVLEIVMKGRTPGKRIANVRIVTRSGDTPSVGALLLRNVFRLVDSIPVGYLVGLVATVLTAQHVRVGDLAAGTVLVLDPPAAPASLAGLAALRGTTLDPRAADLAQEVLDRWKELDDKVAATLARSLLVRMNPQLSAQELEALDAVELRKRLVTTLAPTAAAA
jgi:uncharacterized RDD family membrane protein YckC